MLKHTKGQWKIVEPGWEEGSCDISTDEWSAFAEVVIYTENGYGELEPSEEGRANAKLIASAPDMLDAILFYIKKENDGDIYNKEIYDKYVAIIEKATGLDIDSVLARQEDEPENRGNGI